MMRTGPSVSAADIGPKAEVATTNEYTPVGSNQSRSRLPFVS
jgi:hypothetical protein